MEVVTLELSEEVYRAAQRVADITDQPLSAVLQASIAHTLPPLDDLEPDEAQLLAALATEDDATLWRVARSEMDENEQEEVHLLLDLQNMGQITAPQREQLLALMDTYGRLLVRRAHAYLLLARRGYRVPVQ